MQMLRDSLRSTANDVPGMIMDWGACILFMWALSLPPDWRVALFLFGVSFVGFVVRAAVRAGNPFR